MPRHVTSPSPPRLFIPSPSLSVNPDFLRLDFLRFLSLPFLPFLLSFLPSLSWRNREANERFEINFLRGEGEGEAEGEKKRRCKHVVGRDLKRGRREGGNNETWKSSISYVGSSVRFLHARRVHIPVTSFSVPFVPFFFFFCGQFAANDDQLRRSR